MKFQHRKKIMFLFAASALVLFSIFFFKDDELPASYHYRLPLLDSSQELFEQKKELERSIAINANDHMSLNFLSDIYYTLGRQKKEQKYFDLALNFAKKSLQVSPQGNTQAHLLLAQLKMDQHQFVEAIASVEKVMEENPESHSGYTILIGSLLAIGNVQRAQGYADTLVQKNPNTKNLSLRGLVLLSAGRDIEGVFELEKSFMAEDIGELADSSWARVILARHFLSRGQLSKAEFLTVEALRIKPDHAFAMDIYAQILFRKGDDKGAGAYFEKAFRQSFQVIHLRHMAELNFKINKIQLAMDQWQQAENLNRADIQMGNSSHQLELAKILLRRNQNQDLQEAKALLLKELHVRKTAEIFYLLSVVLSQLQDWQQALDYSIKAIGFGIQKPVYYELLSQIYHEIKQEQRAFLYQKMILNLDKNYRNKFVFD